MDIKQAIDDRPLSNFQRALVLMGFLIIVSDGLDVVILGFIALQLRTEWHVSTQAISIVLSAALFAQIVGAAIAGPLADRFGRRLVVLLSVFWFGGWTLAAALASDTATLVAMRFAAGLGLGAALPNTITLVAEYMPARMQSFMINLATCGFTVGAACGGFMAAWIMPEFGWRGVLVFGGVFPLLLGIALIVWLPESVSFLIARGASQLRIHRIAGHLGLGVPSTTVFTLGADDIEPSGPLRTLLMPRYRFGTLVLWLSYFLLLFAIYLLSSWLPTLIRDAGRYTLSEASIAAAMFQVGGPVGTLAIGWMMDRASKPLVLGGAMLVGVIALAGIGQLGANFAVLCVVSALIGFCLNGSAVGLNALAAAFYPSTARATGVSWMTGFGRAGATLSALGGGALLAWGWSADSVFAVLAIPVLACVVAMFLLSRHQRHSTHLSASRVGLDSASESETRGGRFVAGIAKEAKL